MEPSVCQDFCAELRTRKFTGTEPASGSYSALMKSIKTAAAPAVTVAQLEASYPAYCKALRMLVQDGTSLNKIQRTVCWDRLQLLHTTLPRQYRDPVVHYAMVKRDVDNQQAQAR